MAARAATRAPQRGEPAPERPVAAQPAAEPEQAPVPVRRAGGHVDRGDGRGWVLETEE